jgi:Immunoglobulin-like domain of bacterial spore germination
MKRLAIIIVALGALAAACGSGGPSSLGRVPGDGSSTSRNANPTTTTPPTTTTAAAATTPAAATTTPSAPTAPTTAPAAKPSILVQSPLVGSRVSSPVMISGTADVYEATVNARILDADGREIAVSFTTATCGTGCRGDYSMAVPFSVTSEQEGAIEVLNYSPKDGSPENVVRIPVTLAPSSETGTSPEEAVGAYVRSGGLAYAGDCAGTSVPADAGKYCSALREDHADRRTYGIGPVASEFTNILTLERRGTMWLVTSVMDAPQPAP